MLEYYDVKPCSPVATIPTELTDRTYSINDVLPVVGMAESFVGRVIGNHKVLTEEMVMLLLEQDAFCETFVPRSSVLHYLRGLEQYEGYLSGYQTVSCFMLGNKPSAVYSRFSPYEIAATEAYWLPMRMR